MIKLGRRHDVVGEELVAGGLPALPHLLLGLLLWGGVRRRLHPQVRSSGGYFHTTGTTIMITMMILHGPWRSLRSKSSTGENSTKEVSSSD